MLENAQKPSRASKPKPGLTAMLERVDRVRKAVTGDLSRSRRALLGQYLTPMPIASFMASLFASHPKHIRLLDAGAGAGSLTAAAVAAICARKGATMSIEVTAYEIEPAFVAALRGTLEQCRAECAREGIAFESRVVTGDFILASAQRLKQDLFSNSPPGDYDWAILNPPYRKISADSDERRLLRSVGIETSNLYAAFVALAVKALRPGGEIVAITPRSFCNGPYFQPFRRLLLDEARFRRIHVFDDRNTAFADDEILQENVIYHLEKTQLNPRHVVVSSGKSPDDPSMTVREVPHDRVAPPDDENAFLHVVPNELDDAIQASITALPASLTDLGLTVSTGRVVDFRVQSLLRLRPDGNSVPLIYPCHFTDGYVAWPNDQTKKPNALGPGAEDLLVPGGYYVLVKRFSAKEERRRVVAAVYDPKRVRAERVGFENHVNYFHSGGAGFSGLLARGLGAFLNSTLVDSYFRQFSGHTQVNATDLRSLRYPSGAQLKALGKRIGKQFPDQDRLDQLVQEVVLNGHEAA